MEIIIILVLVIIGETYLIIKNVINRKKLYNETFLKAEKNALKKIQIKEAHRKYYQKNKEKIKAINKANYLRRKQEKQLIK